ncbi:hypothetical protein HK101_012071 [Irineochytrium annulatum]|nr:hypothetical protein HK101_012071 [Irineochytrium annulatum]
MARQRLRRDKRKRTKSAAVQVAFDTNHFTPGTIFMNQLETRSAEITSLIRNHVGREVEVIWSGSHTPGEGEMKLWSYMHRIHSAWSTSRPAKRHPFPPNFVILTTDSDAYVQSLLTPNAGALVLNYNSRRCFRAPDLPASLGAAAGATVGQDLALLSLLALGNDLVPSMAPERREDDTAATLAQSWTRRAGEFQAGTAAPLILPDQRRLNVPALINWLRGTARGPAHVSAASLGRRPDVEGFLRALAWSVGGVLEGSCLDYRHVWAGDAPTASEILWWWEERRDFNLNAGSWKGFEARPPLSAELCAVAMLPLEAMNLVDERLHNSMRWFHAEVGEPLDDPDVFDGEVADRLVRALERLEDFEMAR